MHSFKQVASRFLLALATIACGPSSAVLATDAPSASRAVDTDGLSREPLETLPDEIRRAALAHLETVARDLDSAWSTARLGGVRAIDRPGIRGPGYFDVQVLVDGAPAGFMILTNGTHDQRVVRFSTAGDSPTDEIAPRAQAQRHPVRFVKADVYFGVETRSGHLIASTLDGPEAGRRWREIKAVARKAAKADAKPRAETVQSEASFQSAASYPGKTCWTGGAMSPPYVQLQPGQSPNPSSYCRSGCGPTAWAILIAWIDRQAAFRDTGWYDYRGLVRQGGIASASAPDATAPYSFDDTAQRMTADIRNDLGSICWPGSNNSSTDVYQMGHIGNYLARVGMYGPLEHWTYHIGGAPNGRVGDAAETMICDLKTPAIVGIGDSRHYIVAHGTWRDSSNNLWLWANFGWGGTDHYGVWSLEKTFFAGTLVRKYKPTYQADFDQPPGARALMFRNLSTGTTGADWDSCRGKATCGQGERIVGMSVNVGDGQGERALCRTGGSAFGGSRTGLLSVDARVDQRRAVRNGDWDYGRYKLECGAGEYVTGVGENATQCQGNNRFHGVLCARGTNLTNICRTRILGGRDDRATTVSGDWHVGAYKAECDVSEYVAGVSVSPQTGAPHALLCCRAW